jgi:hypothetical protein
MKTETAQELRGILTQINPALSQEEERVIERAASLLEQPRERVAVACWGCGMSGLFPVEQAEQIMVEHDCESVDIHRFTRE